MAGRATTTKAPPAEQEGRKQEARHYPTPPELRERALAIRQEWGYDRSQVMTPALLHALEPLLNEPVDPRYIQHFPPARGKPYPSTGLQSVQVQIDRLNAILGLPHWRKLLHYTDGGTVCHAHVLVGNNLAHACLSGDGQLLTSRNPGEPQADIILHREGHGGHQQGAIKGDLFKGSETNALKRTIAQIGPGHEIYTLDYDEDVNPADSQFSEPEPEQAQQQPAPPDPNEQIAAILATDDELRELRDAVYKGMQMFDMPQLQRLKLLRESTTREQLEALRNRISMALDEREAQLSMAEA